MSSWIARLLAALIPRDEPENDLEPEGNPPAPDAAHDEGAPSQSRADLDQAAQLEAANRRYEELQARLEEEVQERVQRGIEAGLASLIPDDEFARPQPTQSQRPAPQRQPARDEDDLFTDPEQDVRGAEPNRAIAELQEEIFQIKVDREAEALNSRINALSQQYPSMDRRFVLNELARANRTINLEALARFSHEREEAMFRKRYQAERAKEVAAARSSPPPPIPRGPAGTPVGGSEKRGYNRGETIRNFIQTAKELGWGEGG
jgi:hypothetical protein